GLGTRLDRKRQQPLELVDLLATPIRVAEQLPNLGPQRSQRRRRQVLALFDERRRLVVQRPRQRRRLEQRTRLRRPRGQRRKSAPWRRMLIVRPAARVVPSVLRDQGELVV